MIISVLMRFAKRKLDDWSFYGGVLHVCYAPEYETIAETRHKLADRRRVVESKIKQYSSDGTYSGSLCRRDNTTPVSSSVSSEQMRVSNNISGGQTSSELLLVNDRLSGGISEHDVPPVNAVKFHSYGVQVPQEASCESNYSLTSSTEQSHYLHRNETSSNHRNSVPLQQAHSLRHYGSSFVDRNKKRAISTSILLATDKEKNSSNAECSDEKQLLLPPPPKQIRTSTTVQMQSSKFDSARVPSAQASFPADFDARTENTSGHQSNFEIVNSQNKSDSLEGTQRRTMQEKVEENLKRKDVTIKSYEKPGMKPKFIPRQAQIKMRQDVSNTTGSGTKDRLNAEIQENAFRLGKTQGPADRGPSCSNESLDAKEKAVLDSMQKIRHKLATVGRMEDKPK